MIKISSFNDITGFLLQELITHPQLNISIKYVKNADEAHNDLKSGNADIVCMSYDDTLSIRYHEHFDDINAIAPIHGGMLSFCGHLDSTKVNKVGIDTDSGYARLLRKFIQEHNLSQKYNIQWIYAGATNLRAQKLIDGEIDATLLNPPFCYAKGIQIISDLTSAKQPYQGMVFNVKETYLKEHRDLLTYFLEQYYQVVNVFLRDRDKAVSKLSNYYNISIQQALKSYQRLKEKGGLSLCDKFSRNALNHTTEIFMTDNIK